MSTIKVTNLQNASAASPAIVLDANSRATLNGLSYPTEGSLSGRNRIINGDMRIDARNAGASLAVPNDAVTYTLDRWNVYENTAGAVSVQRSTTAPVGFTNSALITITTADSSIASGDIGTFRQYIEGFNTSDLGWGTASAKTVVLSFWVRSSLTGSLGGAIQNSAGNRSYPFTYTINASGTWEQKTITISGDTSGTWNTDNSAGIGIFFSLCAGSSYVGTANTWAGANYWGATGQVQPISTLNATLYITGVQLEAGSVATPFERRSYGQELALCQRYFQLAEGFMGGSHNSNTMNSAFTFKTEMRANPTTSLTAAMTITNPGVYDRTQSSANVTLTAVSTIGAYCQFGNFSTLTNQIPHVQRNMDSKLQLSAEL